jgi:hypothetical protein
MKLVSSFFIFGLVAGLTYLSSCTSDSAPEGEEVLRSHDVDSTSALMTEFEGRIFSVPSPIQTAILLRQASGSFDASLINPAEQAGNYNTTNKRALNLGVYGADLGYATLFGQQKESLNYLKALQTLADGLSISGAFDKTFVERFERNMSKQDSLLVIVQDAYRTGDNFLKTNKQKDVSALILAGGWIESLFFACSLNDQKKNDRILERIGEQKQSLETLLFILEAYNTNGMNDELLKDLNDLNVSFKEITLTYMYNEPTTKADKNLTILNHTSSFNISDELAKQITEKIKAIRTKIIA